MIHTKRTIKGSGDVWIWVGEKRERENTLIARKGRKRRRELLIGSERGKKAISSLCGQGYSLTRASVKAKRTRKKN